MMECPTLTSKKEALSLEYGKQREGQQTAAGCFLSTRSEGEGIVSAGPSPLSRERPSSSPPLSSRRTISRTWHIDDRDLCWVPKFYPLSKTSLELGDVSSASEAASRTADFLRASSIHAEFLQDRAEARCSGPRDMEFIIRLWRAVREKGGTIMEVQNLGGSLPEFHGVCRELFHSVQNGETSVRNGERIENNVGEIAAGHTDGLDESRVERSLHAIAEMIGSSYMDTKELGLQSLQFLVNQGSVSSVVAAHTADSILNGKTLLTAEVRSTLYQNIHTGMNSSNQRIYGLALQTLAASLDAIRKDEGLSAEFRKWPTCMYWERLVPMLIADLVESARHPQEAYLAERCLNSMAKLSCHARDHALKCGVLPILAEAYGYGKARYLALEKESQDLLSTLTVSG